MNTIEIPERGIVRSLPSSWSEMTPAQVRHVFRLYYRCMTAGRSPLEFNIRVMYYLLNIRRSWRSIMLDRLSPSAAENRNANMYVLCENCLGFMFAETAGERSPQLNFDTLTNPLPSVRTGWFRRRLVGPADSLQNITFGEFRHAATALNRFFKDNRTEDLHECIAFLYRRPSRVPNRAGRKVRPVENGSFIRDVRRAAHIADWQKNLIMMWLAACINYLQTGSVEIDGETVDMAALFAADNERPHSGVPSQTWTDLLIQIAKDQIVGNTERVDEEPLFSVFLIMWHNYKENKRYEKASKSH